MDVMLLVRITNVAVSFVVLALLILSALRQWPGWNQKTKTLWWALVGWVFLGLEMTIENIIQDNDAGPKTIIQTLVLAWTIRALMIKETLAAQPSIPWKKVEEDE